MKKYCLIVLLVCSNLLFSQNKIVLNRIAEPSLLELLNASNALILFNLNDPFFSSTKNKIVFPAIDFIPTDTAFSLLSKKSIGNSRITDEKFVLVFNYKTKTPVIFGSSIPDFTNSRGVILTPEKTVSLQLKTVDNGMIKYFITNEKKQYLQSSSIPHLDASPIDQSFWLTLKNNYTKAGDFGTKKTAFSIAVSDINNNGIFNDVGIDKVFIGNENQKYFEIYDNENNYNSCILKPNIIFESCGKKFIFNKIDPDGEAVYFSPYSGEKESDIKELKNIPDFNFITFKGDTTSILKLKEKGKYLYIDIWASFCNPCIKDLSIFENLQKEYKGKITILGLVDKVTILELTNLITKYNITTLQGLSSSEINKKLLLSGYPHGILFSKDGKLIKMKMNSTELTTFLKEH